MKTHIIEMVKGLGGIRVISDEIEKLSKLKVLVVGEPILDVYRFVNPEGISSKSPTVSCRFLYEEEYQGGSWAIQKHLNDFCDARLLEGPRAAKIRYIAGTQRVFEVTEIEDDYFPSVIPDGFDAYVIADFGHGMFKGGELEHLKGFVGLNVQTNSSNFGFNVYTKHKTFDYLCLDTKEVRLAEHDRHSSPMDVAEKVMKKLGPSKYFSLTVGSNGSHLFYPKKDDQVQEFISTSTMSCPAFSDVVIDATGAGDAYFAITTVLLSSGCDPAIVPFIGNVFAGLKTKIIGNKSAVSKAALLKACAAILK